MSRTSLLTLFIALIAGCTGLLPGQVDAPDTYVLDARLHNPSQRPRGELVLAISMPRARAGYDTAQIAYLRRPYELEYFAKSQWVDTPARMLAPLLVRALEHSGGFRAVLQAPSTVPADLRLDTELTRLQHDFGTQPSRVELALRAQLVDLRTKRVLAEREFEEVEIAPSEDAYGGVIAANRALQRMLAQLAEFCATRPGGS
jgi:cholesterol transport system auxiliary component